jgi:hypothetical protein
MNLISWKRYAKDKIYERNCKKSAKLIWSKIDENTSEEKIREMQPSHSAVIFLAEKTHPKTHTLEEIQFS